MALISCPECGKGISDQAQNCPNCGFAINNFSTYNNNYNGNNYNNYNAPQNNYNNNNSDKSLKGGGVGFALTFFLGIIGLVLCLCLGDDACKKAATTTFIVSICLIVAFYGLIFLAAGLESCA